MNKSEIIRFLILRSIGNFLLLFAIFGVFATFGPALYYEVSFRIGQARGVHYTVQVPTPSLLGEILKEHNIVPASPGFASVLAGPKEQILIPIDTSFDVLIPKIGANARVIPNVDPSNEKEYLAALQKGVAHARGSVFPGIKGTTYLFAHSTDSLLDVGRYNAVFYLLKDLVIGDDVVIFFNNQRYNYAVTDTKIVDPEDISFITKSQATEEQLVLQTCWPPGTVWKRLLVTAKRKT